MMRIIFFLYYMLPFEYVLSHSPDMDRAVIQLAPFWVFWPVVLVISGLIGIITLLTCCNYKVK